MGSKAPMPRRQVWPFPLVAIIVALIPWVLTSRSWVSTLTFIGIYSILALGLNLLMGYAGQVSLGHAAFYGIGAYTAAILTTMLKWPAWFGLFSGVAVGGMVAYLIGIPTLKLRGHYLAMATLGFGMVAQVLFREYYPLTGGTSGIIGVPSLSIAGITLKGHLYYYLVWFFALLLMWLSYNIVDSRVGRALRAVHGSEIAASSVGIDITKHKVQVFVLSGMYSGLAGALYAYYTGFVNPDPFGFMFSIKLVVMVVVGGMASIWGSVLGASAIRLLESGLYSFQEYEVAVYGLVLVLVMIYMPAGLTKTAVDLIAQRRVSRLRRQSGGQT